MKADRFNEIFAETIQRSESVLVRKAGEYADDEDRLHNFKKTAALTGQSQREALAGFMAKHVVSVYDMVYSGKDYPLELWDEKILDNLNYLILLRAAIVEEADSKKMKIPFEMTQVNSADIRSVVQHLAEKKPVPPPRADPYL